MGAQRRRRCLGARVTYHYCREMVESPWERQRPWSRLEQALLGRSRCRSGRTGYGTCMSDLGFSQALIAMSDLTQRARLWRTCFLHSISKVRFHEPLASWKTEADYRNLYADHIRRSWEYRSLLYSEDGCHNLLRLPFSCCRGLPFVEGEDLGNYWLLSAEVLERHRILSHQTDWAQKGDCYG